MLINYYQTNDNEDTGQMCGDSEVRFNIPLPLV